MKSFIDSQLLIGLLNPKDSFHKISREFIESKDVVLLEAVRKEDYDSSLIVILIYLIHSFK